MNTLNKLNSINLDEKNKFISNETTQSINDDENDDDDDIDTALSKLEKTLDVAPIKTDSNDLKAKINSSSKPVVSLNNKNEISTLNKKTELNGNGTSQVELSEDLFLMKQQKYTFKKFKSYYFVLTDTHYLSYYKTKEDSNGKPIDKINLKGCELVPDVNVAGRKYGINLRVPSLDGMTEMSLRCPNEESYAQWMSACKLASRNKSISDPTFKIEVKSILNLLSMQQKKNISSPSYAINEHLSTHSKSLIGSSASIDSKSSNDSAEVQASNLLPLRMTKKYKLKQVILVNKNKIYYNLILITIFNS